MESDFIANNLPNKSRCNLYTLLLQKHLNLQSTFIKD
jgi:hypothetical protein